jgi:tellurite methyltransferase
MEEKGLGQYDSEYLKCDCFWGIEPGKFVKQISELVTPGSVLDLGCGEGKNAIYLAEQGFKVLAVDCSEPALKNFRKRLQQISKEVSERIVICHEDVKTFIPLAKFDVVIAYGLLHCLSNYASVDEVILKMRSCTSPLGLNVAVAFTDTIEVPAVQNYLEPTLLPLGYLESRYSDWYTVAIENEIIEETHPTSAVAHKHSLCRIIARQHSQEDLI